MNDNNTEFSIPARFVMWSIRKKKGQSFNLHETCKVGSGLFLGMSVLAFVLSFVFSAPLLAFLGLIFLQGSLMLFLKAGFVELIDKGYTHK
jgi:hypothetical protein